MAVNLPTPVPDDEAPRTGPNIIVVQEAARIEAARRDVNAFISYCFLEGRPQHRFHAEWQNIANTEKYAVIFSAVEHGKTEQISVWRKCWELGRNPNERHWILSATEKLAARIVGQLEAIIINNEKVHRVFPDLRPEDRKGRHQQWNTNGFIIRRTEADKDPTVQACGIMGSAIGARIDVLTCDDITSFKTAYFPAQRERSIEWFRGQECMGRVTADARVTMITNAWNDQSLPHVAVNTMKFKAFKYPACDENLGSILWPTEKVRGRTVGWNSARLAERAGIVGPVEFARAFLCEPISDHTEFFSMSKMLANVNDRLRSSTPIPESMIPICGVDPAVSKKARTGESAFFYGGVDPKTGMKQVRNIISARMNATEIIKMMLTIYRLQPRTRFVVESNGQQEYLIQVLSQKEILRSIGATEIEAVSLRAHTKPFLTTEKKTDPTVGVASMAADFEAMSWDIPNGAQTEKWFRQALAYHPGIHTGDVLMASYFFWHEANRLSVRRATMPPSVLEMMKKMGPMTELSGIHTEAF